MVRYCLRFGFLLCICSLVVPQVTAGQRHGSQTVCDSADLIGAAFGACNAYCEALDCDGSPGRGSSKACENTLERFMDLTGELPPCEPACPCASGWLHPEFIPEMTTATSCYRQISDHGEFLELTFSTDPDDSGNSTLSGAMIQITDDENWGWNAFECFSDHVVDNVLSDDSGSFAIQSTFLPEPDAFDRQQNGYFRSCLTVFERLIEENALQCEDVDFRSE